MSLVVCAVVYSCTCTSQVPPQWATLQMNTSTNCSVPINATETSVITLEIVTEIIYSVLFVVGTVGNLYVIVMIVIECVCDDNRCLTSMYTVICVLGCAHHIHTKRTYS